MGNLPSDTIKEPGRLLLFSQPAVFSGLAFHHGHKLERRKVASLQSLYIREKILAPKSASRFPASPTGQDFITSSAQLLGTLGRYLAFVTALGDDGLTGGRK